MPSIKTSVGKGGRNVAADVETVQALLNKHCSMAGFAKLKVDGDAGKKTIGAIKAFQTKVVKISADGRVDPGGKTLGKLNCSPSQAKKEAQEEKKESKKEDKKEDSGKVDPAARKVFVSAKVIEKTNTKRIINKIMPAFKGVNATVISGYLDDEAQFWKVNYHWEYLLWMIDHSMTLEIDEKFVKNLKAIRRSLMRNQPNPKKGYRTGGIGKPSDTTPIEKITQRWQIVRQAKKDFKQVTVKAGLKQKSTKTGRAFDLAVAPIARPGTSKHGTGYALDIKGDNGKIKQISNKLGASLVFDEKSHVHVEFANL